MSLIPQNYVAKDELIIKTAYFIVVVVVLYYASVIECKQWIKNKDTESCNLKSNSIYPLRAGSRNKASLHF